LGTYSDTLAATLRSARDRLRRASGFIFLAFLYLSISAAVFNGFYQKWGLRDFEKRYSFVEMIEGTAHRPFVHRQLLPAAANLTAAILPERLTERARTFVSVRKWWERRSFLDWLTVSEEVRDRYLTQYLFVYYASFLSFALALFVLREVALAAGMGVVAATVAPPAFAIVFQYFLSMGGFFYDFPEILFLALATLIAQRYAWPLLVPVTLLATYNKESFLFFLPALLPFLNARLSRAKSVAIVAAMCLISGVTYLIVRHAFAHNPGSAAESWFIESLKFYLTPINYFAVEINWGITTPRAFSVVGIFLIWMLVSGAWSRLSPAVKNHTLISAAITVPLVLVFCGPGEMRNFSLCYVALFLMIAQTLATWVRGPAPAA
jgi:hypothetical protein